MVRGDVVIKSDAARKIVIKYYDDIYRFCLAKLRNDADAQDVVQDTFLALQINSERLDDADILAWLFSVANRKIKKKYQEYENIRDIAYFDDEAVAESEIFAVDIDELKTLTDTDIERAKKKLFEKLSPCERVLFEMIYVEKMAYSDIASKLNLSEEATRVRAFRLRAGIKKLAKNAFLTGIFIMVKLKM